MVFEICFEQIWVNLSIQFFTNGWGLIDSTSPLLSTRYISNNKSATTFTKDRLRFCLYYPDSLTPQIPPGR